MQLFKRCVSAVALAAALTLSTQPAFAQSDDDNDRSVEIHNHTGSTVGWIYASNVGTDSWENDMLGRGRVMLPEAKVRANIDDGTGYCRYDIKVVFTNNAKLYKYKVNVCTVTVVDIYPDGIRLQYAN